MRVRVSANIKIAQTVEALIDELRQLPPNAEVAGLGAVFGNPEGHISIWWDEER